MELYIIFIDNTNPSIDSIWKRQFREFLRSNNACLVSIEPSSVLRLHSINHEPNSTAIFKEFKSWDQLADRARALV